MALKLEGLCSQTEARWFYWGWSRVYDVMQPYFTSDEMREEGLDMAELPEAGPLRVLDVGAGTGTLSRQVLQRVPAADITLRGPIKFLFSVVVSLLNRGSMLICLSIAIYIEVFLIFKKCKFTLHFYTLTLTLTLTVRKSNNK